MYTFGLRNIPLLAVLALACAPVAFGQTITGTVRGSVQDESGAAIAGATVDLTNTGTGVTQTRASNTAGNFDFLLLLPGVYTVKVTNAGFSTSVREGIIVEADRSLSVPMTLAIGAMTQRVEVVAGTPLLEPNTSDVGTVVVSQQVMELPLNSRNSMGLANLVPTVRGIGGFGGQVLTSYSMGAVTVGGGAPLSSSFLVDGMANDKLGDASGPMTFLATDATEEFKVITNSMSAEFGRTGGGVMSIISKSGTNGFHGSLFEYLQNNVLDANDFFSNRSGAPLAPIRQNQWGGSLGGRIIREKLFFYGNFEGFNQHLSETELVTSPTALQRGGDFSRTFTAAGQMITIYDPLTTVSNPNQAGASIRQPFPGNVIPTNRISPFAQATLALFPAGNTPGQPVTNQLNLYLSGVAPTDRQTGGVRVDYNINSGERLALRYTRDTLNESVADAHYFNSVMDHDRAFVYVPRHSASLQYTYNIRPTLLLELKSGFNRDYDQSLPWSQSGKYAKTGFPLTSLGLPASLVNQLQTGPNNAQNLFPSLTIGDLSVPVGSGTGPSGRAAYTWANGASITKIRGSHTLKMGYEYRLYTFNPYDRTPMAFTFDRGFTQGPNPNVTSTTSGDGIASFLLGMPSSGTATFNAVNAKSQHYHAAYVQDDWKASQKLTLNLGLRWEYDGPMVDRFNALANFDPNMVSPLQVPGLSLKGGIIYPGVNGVPRGVTDSSYRHWGPRLGLAYQATSKLVVRSAYGINYVPVKGNGSPYPATGFSSINTMNTSLNGGLTPYNTITDPFPSGLVVPTNTSLGAITGIGTSVRALVRTAKPGYVQQWSLTLQYSPWANWLLEGDYIGNKGTNLLTLQGQNLDQINPQYLQLGNALNNQVPNPFYGMVSSGPLSTSTVAQQQLLLPYPQYTGVSTGWAFLGNSTFHAATFKAEKRLSNGLSVLASYTVSKMLDGAVGSGGAIRSGAPAETGVQNWYNLRLEKSKSMYDTPQRLILTALWAVPLMKGSKGWKQQVLAGWNVNSILTLQSGFSLSLQSKNATTRPNVVPGVSDKAVNQSLSQWFNTAAFTPPAPFTYGNVSRTLPNVMSDRMFDLDSSLYKVFSLRERFKLELKGEAFNLTNTPTFAAPGTDVTTATFGVVSATAMSPKPRAVQLSLRLTF